MLDETSATQSASSSHEKVEDIHNATSSRQISPIDEIVEELDEDSCLICLGNIQDRTILPACQHSLFCFSCIIQWTSIHQRCPLCNTEIEGYVIHSIRNDNDYIRHKLPEKVKGEEKGCSDLISITASQAQNRTFRPHPYRTRPQYGQYRQEASERWEKQLSIRRRIYRQSLYCKHMGTNRSSRLVAPASPSTIAKTPSLQQTLLHFIRRELLAFPMANLDVDFLATYSINVFRSLYVKSNESITLLADFLGMEGAQHFCHEVYTFLRFISAGSGVHPDKMAAFDAWASYDWPEVRVSERLLSRRKNDDSGSLLNIKEPRNAAEEGKMLQNDEDAMRMEIIQRRARLLNKLEAERDKSRQKGKSGTESLHDRILLRLANERALAQGKANGS